MQKTIIKTYYVYFLIDPRDNIPFYVGKGNGQRMYEHERYAIRNYRGSNLPRHNRIREIVNTGLKVQYLQVYKTSKEYLALVEESMWINFYGKIVDGTGCLLNGKDGGGKSGKTVKAVDQYTLTGVFIRNFESIKDASEQTTGNRTYISACCKKLRLSSGGFLWAYEGEAPTPYGKMYYRPVTQWSLDGKLIDTFASLTEAQHATGIELHNISECCREKSKTAGGFVWKYISKK